MIITENIYNTVNHYTIKDNLKRVVKQNKLRQSDIMDLGFNKWTVQAWFNSGLLNRPTWDQLQRIINYYGMKIEEFVFKC